MWKRNYTSPRAKSKGCAGGKPKCVTVKTAIREWPIAEVAQRVTVTALREDRALGAVRCVAAAEARYAAVVEPRAVAEAHCAAAEAPIASRFAPVSREAPTVVGSSVGLLVCQLYWRVC
jgi:hypothetical protein